MRGLRPRAPLAALLAALLGAAALAACSATSGGGGDHSEPPSGTAAPSIAATPGPGVTASTITLTYRGYNDQSKADAGPIVTAIVKAYNAAGGIAGRQVSFVPMPFGKSDPKATTQEAAQANCLAVAQATPKIFAVLSDPPDADFDACLNDRGIPVVLGANFLAPDRTLSMAPYSAGFAVSATHAAQALTQVLQKSDYLSDATKIAVVDAASDGMQDAVRATLIPGLEQAGTAKVKEYTLAASASAGGAAAAASSLVLRMRADGSDRVVIFGQDPGLAILTEQMVKQKFTPRLAELGLFATYGLKAMGLQNATPQVLRDLVTFFWDATAGTPEQQQQWRASNAAAQHCAGILTANHLPTSDATLFTALPLCEGLDLLKAALAKSGSQAVNAQAFATGIAKLGTFAPITAFGATFSASRHDGDSAYKLMSYQTACKCFAYTGDPQPIGAGS